MSMPRYCLGSILCYLAGTAWGDPLVGYTIGLFVVGSLLMLWAVVPDRAHATRGDG